jgi:hypothetical protein
MVGVGMHYIADTYRGGQRGGRSVCLTRRVAEGSFVTSSRHCSPLTRSSSSPSLPAPYTKLLLRVVVKHAGPYASRLQKYFET